MRPFYRHSHAHHHGGELQHPRFYEFTKAVGMLGLQRFVYDGLVRLSGAKPGERVLDVGCGTGYFTRRAAKAVGPRGRVIGVDPSTPMVEYARRHSPSNCDYHVAGGQDVPEADASFDLVISSLAVHHIPAEERAAAAAEMFRVLKPGGRLFVADFRSQADMLRELLTGAGFTITGEGRRRPLFHYFQAAR